VGAAPGRRGAQRLLEGAGPGTWTDGSLRNVTYQVKTVTLTVSICSAARRDDLVRCIRSVALIPDLTGEVLIGDNGYDPPLSVPELREKSALPGHWDLRITRMSPPLGPNAARNHMAREARGGLLLSLDDDAYVIEGAGISRAVGILQRDASVGAIAFRQCLPDGSLDPAQGQASLHDSDCYAPAFGAYAAMMRTRLFVDLGGYRELCWATGKEPEFCKRLYGAGFSVVAVPENAVAHCPSPVGRDELRRLRFGFRNRIYDAFLNEPALLVMPSVSLLLVRYGKLCRMTRQFYKVDTRGSFRWLFHEVQRDRHLLRQARRPIPWRELRRYRAMASNPPYSLNAAQ